MGGNEQLIQSLISEGYLKSQHIIEAFRAIDRADFVLPEFRNEAYGNYPLPIGYGQTISQPLTVAFMLELLDPGPGERILDVGAGSGWVSALLAFIACSSGRTGAVVSAERIPGLCESGRKNIDKYGFIKDGKVEFCCLDATAGIPAGPYDKIIASASASGDIPGEWRDALKVGGKIVAPVGGSIKLFIKKSATEWSEQEFPGFAFVPLIHNDPDSGEIIPKFTPPKRTKLIISGLVLFLACLSVIEIYFPFRPPDRAVDILPGMGTRKIAEVLKQEGIIHSKWLFIAYVTVQGSASDLKPGRYYFTHAIAGAVADLIKGGSIERGIVIPEGWNLSQISDYLAEENIFAAKTFLRDARSRSIRDSLARDFGFLAEIPEGLDLEGYLFPDTYRIFSESGSENIMRKMLENFSAKVTPELRAEIARQRKTLFKIITMASLIEKEVVSNEDRAVVSGILWKRMNLGIPLQVDATIAYIKNQESGIRNQDSAKISIEDTKIDSPYNTYKYAGLPIGPISNPGISAIRAAIFPKNSPYFYYLSAPGGKTIFSPDLDAHNEAKAKYLSR